MYMYMYMYVWDVHSYPVPPVWDVYSGTLLVQWVRLVGEWMLARVGGSNWIVWGVGGILSLILCFLLEESGRKATA